MPQARAAIAFDPRANTGRPNTLRGRTREAKRANTKASQAPGGTTNQDGLGNAIAKLLSQVAGALTVCSPESHFARPRAIPSIPRVAINGTTRRVVIVRPFTKPTIPPTSTPAASAGKGGHPARTARAQVTPVRAITEPGDRSMPPLTM